MVEPADTNKEDMAAAVDTEEDPTKVGVKTKAGVDNSKVDGATKDPKEDGDNSKVVAAVDGAVSPELNNGLMLNPTDTNSNPICPYSTFNDLELLSLIY